MHNVSGLAEDKLELIHASQIQDGDNIVISSEACVYHVEGNLVRGAGVTSFDATYHPGSRLSRILLVDGQELWRVKS